MKTEVDFALLRISEKRYKAEKEVEQLKEVIKRKNDKIFELQMKLRESEKKNKELSD